MENGAGKLALVETDATATPLYRARLGAGNAQTIQGAQCARVPRTTCALARWRDRSWWALVVGQRSVYQSSVCF